MSPAPCFVHLPFASLDLLLSVQRDSCLKLPGAVYSLEVFIKGSISPSPKLSILESHTITPSHRCPSRLLNERLVVFPFFCESDSLVKKKKKKAPQTPSADEADTRVLVSHKAAAASKSKPLQKCCL